MHANRSYEEAVPHTGSHSPAGVGLQGLSEADQLAFRSSVIEQVLATDMKRHFNILSRFQVGCLTQTVSLPQMCACQLSNCEWAW